MKFSIKRTLSLLLVLVMLVGLLPIVALAADGDSDDTTDPPTDTTTKFTYSYHINGDQLVLTTSVGINQVASGWSQGNSNTVWKRNNVSKNLPTGQNYTFTVTEAADGTTTHEISIDRVLPEISGIADGESFCVNTEFTVTDDSGIASVTGADAIGGKYVLSTIGTVTIVVTDSVGNKTTITVNVQDHTWDEGVETKAPTCTDAGEKTFTCSNCKKTRTESIPATGEGSHVWDEGKVTKEPTCTEAGEKTFTCSECGATKTEVIEATGHKKPLTLVPAKAATCGSNGNTKHYKCSVCGALFEDAEGKTSTTIEKVTIPATSKNHIASSWIVGQYPTEKRNGYMYKKCTVCGTHLDYMVLTWRDVKPTLPFVDVDSKDSYFDAVCYVYDKGLMKGTSDTRFSPSRSFDRAMVAMILYRMEGRPSVKFNSVFPDVSKNDWYADCISWAYKNGVLKGYDDGTARPDDPVTVEQLLTILYRYADSEGYRVTGRGSVDRYYDADDISAYALKAVRWAVSEGLISGRGYLGPKSNASRAEVAEILTNFCKNVLNYK